jgi:ABC-type uncharacterized transport system permease subunit
MAGSWARITIYPRFGQRPKPFHVATSALTSELMVPFTFTPDTVHTVLSRLPFPAANPPACFLPCQQVAATTHGKLVARA